MKWALLVSLVAIAGGVGAARRAQTREPGTQARGAHAPPACNVEQHPVTLSADTRGLDGSSRKTLHASAVEGVRYPAAVEVDIDWSAVENRCFLSGALVLSADAPDGRNWVKLEYVGVPPGHGVRRQLVVCRAGDVRTHFLDGWPANREGRALDRARAGLRLGERIEVLEGGRVEHVVEERAPFDRGSAWLEWRSHGNYPSRPLTFDKVVVRP